MADLSRSGLSPDNPLAPVLERLSQDAACAADALEATAADLGAALDALLRGGPAAGDVIARLRRRRAWLVGEAEGLRERLRVTDDAVTARMAAAMIAEFGRAEQAELTRRPAAAAVLRVIE